MSQFTLCDKCQGSYNSDTWCDRCIQGYLRENRSKPRPNPCTKCAEWEKELEAYKSIPGDININSIVVKYKLEVSKTHEELDNLKAKIAEVVAELKKRTGRSDKYSMKMYHENMAYHEAIALLKGIE